MPRCSAAGLDFRIILAGFNAPPVESLWVERLEFLTGFTICRAIIIPTNGILFFHFNSLILKDYFKVVAFEKFAIIFKIDPSAQLLS
jgi:hypothetical protein